MRLLYKNYNSLWRFKLALLAIFIVATAGCSSTNTYQSSGLDERPSQQQLSRIITDSTLDKRAFVRSITTINKNNLLHVQVNLRNHEGWLEWFDPEQRGFRYKFTWFDEQGMKIYNPNESWKRKMIAAQQFTTVTGIAPSPRAVDWRLSIHPWEGH